MAIPFILIRGYHTLLSSNAGTFVDGPTIDEPGWSALVSATPLSAAIEVVDGGVSGAVLIVPPGDVAGVNESETGAAPSGTLERGGGTIVLIPGDLSMPAVPRAGQKATPRSQRLLADVAPASAGEALEVLLNVELVSIEVMSESAWAQVLRDASYQLDNPDPVPIAATERGAAGGAVSGDADDVPKQLAFAVGPVAVGGADAAAFLGRPVDGGSLSSVMPRRRMFWSAMLETPPAADHPLANALRAVGSAGQVVELPTVQTPDTLTIDATAAEDLLRDVVAFPSGQRLEIRVVDRSGHADLGLIAAQLAGRGIEVVEIANAVQFDDGSTELIRPVDLADAVDQFDGLVAELGVEPIIDPEQEHDTVTLLVGTDFQLDP